MPTLKRLSQITPAASKPALTDQLVAVLGGTTDALVNISQLGGRQILMADANYYVTATGSDSGDGSIGNPWATLQHAANVIANTIDIASFQVFINIGPGTFAGLYLPSFFGGGIVQFNGSGRASTTITSVSAPIAGSYVVNACFGNINGQVSVVSINAVELSCGGASACVSNYGLAFIGVGDASSNFANLDITFDIGHHSFGIETGGFGAAVYMSPNTTSNPLGTVNIQCPIPDAFGIILCEFGSSCILTCSPTVLGTPEWGSAGIRTTSGGAITNNAATFSGAATGLRYLCEFSSLVDDNFAGYNWIPGNVNGTIDGTSTYGETRLIRVLPANPSGTQTFNNTQDFIFPFNNTVPITVLIKAITVGNTQYPDPVSTLNGGSGFLRLVNVGTGGVTITGDTGITVNGVLAGSVSMGGQYTSMMGYLIAQDNWVFLPGIG